MLPRKIMLEVVVRDRRGRVIARRRKRAGYLKNFTAVVRGQCAASSETMITIGGASYGIAYSASISNQRIRVGSSSTAVDPDNYCLGSELGFTSAAFGTLVKSGQNTQFTISGSVSLAGGGTVREVGFSIQKPTYEFLLLRDVVPEVVVPVGGTCTVTYTLIFTA